MSSIRSRWILLLIGLLCATPLAAFEPFKISDIRVEGLQRISAGTVFNYLPLRIGQQIDEGGTAAAIRSLYKTGFFDDVRIERQDDVLIVFVRERPAIAKIDITGNKTLETEQLLTSLKDIGLAEGRVFNRFILDRIALELRRQYFNLGKYAVDLETSVTPLERNRVGIAITIKEGASARIKRINLVGNHSFDEEELLKQLELQPSGWLSFLTKDDQYSRQKLSADLETLRSYYLDRGFINFKIVSTQVSISPDNQDIYVTINLDEGDVYTISDVKLAGDLTASPETFFPLIQLVRGKPFSRKEVTGSADRITAMLGDQGYAFANVNSIPDIDDEKKEVSITYFVDPGKRVYVRRVNMTGNNVTRDEVLRREMRQLEASWFSAAQTRKSRERLQRLGYFEEVSVETPAVPGSTDQVDVNIAVTEKSMGSLSAGLGFSQSQGIILNANITQNNFLGTGKRISLGMNTSTANTFYKLGYTNPYYTVDGISRGFVLSYRKTDFAEVDIANYLIDTSRAGVTFGIPTNETDRVVFDFDITDSRLKLGTSPSNELKDFVANNGDSYLDFVPKLSWTHDSRDSALLPTRGGQHRLSGSISMPGSDLEYYRLSYATKYYVPLTRTFTLALRGDVGYGDAFGGTSSLPPWRNFFAGGSKTVRGFKDFSLGPRDSDGDPLGGNVRIVGNAEILFPAPFKLMDKTVRLGLFLDAGNVYDTAGNGVDLGELRYSVGVSGFWLSPFGAFNVSLGMPLNDTPDDDTELFQFSIGTGI